MHNVYAVLSSILNLIIIAFKCTLFISSLPFIYKLIDKLILVYSMFLSLFSFLIMCTCLCFVLIPFITMYDGRLHDQFQ
jgi:hypothetical protein